MPKFKFVSEYEIRASIKMIFPYLSTASGMKEWFCDEAHSTDGRGFEFIWDGKSHAARMIAKRTNSHVRYQFLPDLPGEELDLAYIDFKIDYNEMTQSSFLKVTDYSEMDDLDELHELWDQLIYSLREVLGSGVGS